ncbi:metallophosphoesterase family protein [Lewinella sp. IMCC34183]|uniref:metallophosphoesterase family protein n=1 Tax=Lewinella sp. IMCC34183 TaxID=2248762 RepID=UPI000E26BBEE|nr:metallophosphoesterase [Lewinella sp. IMCC34183]
MAFRIVQFTDPHLLVPPQQLMGLDVCARFTSALDAAARWNPDAYVFTGDFCAHDPDEEVYHYLRPQLDRLGVSYFITAGNHDDRSMLREAFELPGSGDAAIYGEVRVGGRSLLLLDSSRGIVEPEQLDWLAEILPHRPDAPVFMHHPPLQMGVRFMDEKYPLRDTERTLKILQANGPRRVFCGHYHTTRLVNRSGLEVFLCPPTSFFIRPEAPEFVLEDRPPGYLLLEWTDRGDFRCVEQRA